MRVITGTARGMRLNTLAGDNVRPTPEKVKEAIFSVIQFRIEGRRFLDLFAGSGQMGIEALSRGAAKAVFVDAGRDSIAVIKKNLQSTGLEKNAEVINTDSITYLTQKREKFDIAFLDPPYRKGLLQDALSLIEPVMNRGGTIIAENPMDEDLPDNVGDFTLYRTYRFGKIRVGVYTVPDEEE